MKRGIVMLLIYAIGCSPQGEIVVHDRGVVSSESPERLLVVVKPGEEEAIRLLAYREREQTLEIHYWKMPTSGAPAQRGTVRAGDDGSGWGELLGYAALGALILVCGVVYAGAAALVGGFRGLARAIQGHQPPFDESPVTVWRVESVRERCTEATIERANGGARFPLGIQPTEGWLLDDETVSKLGGRLAPVIVRDADLSTEVRLGSPR